MKEISSLAKDVLKQTINSYYQPLNKSKVEINVEVLIFGYCDRNEKYEAFRIKYTKNMQSVDEIKVISHSFESEEYCILGDRISLVQEKILNKNLKTNNLLVAQRAPLYALQDIIQEEQGTGSIGGHLQLAVCGASEVIIKGFLDEQLNFSFCGVNPHFKDNQATLLRSLGGFVVLPPVMAYPSEKDENCISGTLQKQ